MAKRAKAVGVAIKYGPIFYAAAQRYGPVVWEQLQRQREPAERFVQSTVAKGNQRKKALAHAQTLREGSVLQVFHANEAHWVVFTGERPVAVHPATPASFETLLEDADLDRRIYPGEAAVTVKIRRPQRSRRSSPPQAPGRTPPGSGRTVPGVLAAGPAERGAGESPGEGTDEQPRSTSVSGAQRPTA